MVAKVKHLLNRDGRYFTRIVIPKELRPFLNNKSDLREPLGAVAAQTDRFRNRRSIGAAKIRKQHQHQKPYLARQVLARLGRSAHRSGLFAEGAMTNLTCSPVKAIG